MVGGHLLAITDQPEPCFWDFLRHDHRGSRNRAGERTAPNFVDSGHEPETAVSKPVFMAGVRILSTRHLASHTGIRPGRWKRSDFPTASAEA